MRASARALRAGVEVRNLFSLEGSSGRTTIISVASPSTRSLITPPLCEGGGENAGRVKGTKEDEITRPTPCALLDWRGMVGVYVLYTIKARPPPSIVTFSSQTAGNTMAKF